MKIFESIQVLRLIAALGVMLFHASAVLSKRTPSINPESFEYGKEGVLFFFVISGFVIAHASSTIKRGSLKPILAFLFKRFARIFPTYWLFALLTYAVIILKPQWTNQTIQGILSVVNSIFLLPSNDLPVVMVAWSLTFELYFYLVFTLLIFIFAPNGILWSLLVWISVIFSANFIAPIRLLENPYSGLVLHYYSIPFISGLFCYWLHQKKRLVLNVPLSLILSVFFALCGYVIVESKLGPVLRTSLLSLIFSLILLLSVYMDLQGRIKIPRFLILFGDASYVIYLSHILILNGVAKIWDWFLSPEYSEIWTTSFLTLSLVLVLAVSVIIHLYFEKPIGAALRAAIPSNSNSLARNS